MDDGLQSAFMIEKRREAAKALAQAGEVPPPVASLPPLGAEQGYCRAGKKKQAILALKTKKMIEQQLASTEGQLMQLEEMVRTASHNPTKQCLRLPNL
jgi:hypothetical protein